MGKCKNTDGIKVVLHNPEVKGILTKKAIHKLYELYMEAKLKGELDNLR